MKRDLLPSHDSDSGCNSVEADSEKRPIPRRQFLGTVGAGSIAALAGCSFGKDDEAQTTPSATTTSTPTPTGEVPTALRTAQENLAEAWDELWTHRAVDEGELLLETAYIIGFDLPSITGPVAAAQNTLEQIRGQDLSEEEQTRVSALVAFSSNLKTKGQHYNYLFAAHELVGRATKAFARGDIKTAVAASQRAETTIAEASVYLDDVHMALTDLGRVGGAGVTMITSAFKTFDIEREQGELSILSAFVAEYSATASGMQAFFSGIRDASEGTDAYKDGRYASAVEFYKMAVDQMRGAEDYLMTALERDVRYHTADVEMLNCLAPGFREAFDYYRKAAEAARDGAMQQAETLRDKGSEKYRATLQECRTSSGST